ncbi:MAG: NADH-quinone oxidoreductase subunit NuoG [Bacteroidales bacterium]|nr:NADH-quinone oxidoreductase subunit NuoG [Bacteroidales bacterium]
MMVKIQIDGTYYDVKPGKNLLETCLALGIDVPHFCYHGAMGSVGACRLCAVKKFRDPCDQKGRIIMSCMEPVNEGLIVSVNDPDAKMFRAAILESLMINHPHDCPVCDEGGECHLQDMLVMTGHNYRRFDFKKRTHFNQYLGPFISHEMNRCIQCYRCVRFYDDYTGGKDLAVFGSHDHLYFGRGEDGILESEFSGNLVEVCPTGVFTDKTLKEHYTRKWDLSNTPSVCVHCSIGCNTIAGERYGKLRRIMSRYNGAVNGYFLCDRGRFGYQFVNVENRIGEAQIRTSKNSNPVEATPDMIASACAEALSGSKKIAGIGSPRASLEANFALQKLVGKENFFAGVSRTEHTLAKTAIDILQHEAIHSPSLKEIEKADAILILGEDLTNTAPMAALAVRQAARNKGIEVAGNSGIPPWNDYAVRLKAQDVKSPIIMANPFSAKLDEIAEKTYRAAYSDIARVGFAVAALINDGAPGVKGLSKEQLSMAQHIANALKEAKNPMVITGTHGGSEDMVHAAANIAMALFLHGKEGALSIVFPECNSMGLGMMDGKPFEDLAGLPADSTCDTLVILENDLYRRADQSLIDDLLERCKNVIVLDHLITGTTLKSDILLPVGTFAESEGTLVNNEGRAQRFYRVFPAEGTVIESWRQLKELMIFSGNHESASWENFDHVAQAMSDSIPAFAKIKGHMPGADFRILNEKIKRQTMRFSGRTAMNAQFSVSEPKSPVDPDSPLAFSMEGANETPPSSLVTNYWTPGWNSNNAMNFYLDEPNGSMKGGDPGFRLLETAATKHILFFAPVTGAFTPEAGEWEIVPAYQIFGSEELSSQGPAVAERIPEPFIIMNRRDAEEAGVKEHEMIDLTLTRSSLQVKLKIDDNIPAGVAGLSTGLPGMPFLKLPESGRVKNSKK